MSIFSHCRLTAENAIKTAEIGRSLAKSLYHINGTILLTGELGAGKTTFSQGFARGLGIANRVLSPTYALEQRYEQFTHIDLYRLSPQQASDFLAHSEDTSGIRLIEWAERIDPALIGPHIHVHLEEEVDGRVITCNFLDSPVPKDEMIEEWMKEVRLPVHIQAHIRAVTDVADTCTDLLIGSGRIVRQEAVHAAAMTHDLLRFLDFASWEGDDQYAINNEDRAVWTVLKERYAPPHERAAAEFLSDRGFPVLGEIVRSHRGLEKNGDKIVKTIEQKLLAYSDKRVMFDRKVTLDERYDDFILRYGKGEESDHTKAWRIEMKQMEAELFPGGAPDTAEL